MNEYLYDYSMKVKGIGDSLGSIGALADDEDLVFVTMTSLGKYFAKF